MVGKQDAVVQINPDILRWAMAGSGWDARELSEKTNINSESILKWERSSASIKVSDLRKISEVIRRPLSVLLLPEPPKERLLTDYRKVGWTDPKKLSKKTLAVIRNARYVQSNAREMLELRSENALPNITSRRLGDDPETVAATERKALGVELEKRRKGEDIDRFVRAAYLDLKEKIESRNIPVMQAAMDVNEIRGLVLSDGHPRVILVNSNDKARSQFFTLLHEYAHLLLKTDGICLTNSENFKKKSRGQDVSVERWCNEFAGAVIMPREKALKELSRKADRKPNRVVTSMSSKFCTSKMAAAVRILNLLGNDSRREEYIEYYRMISSKPVTATRGGRAEEGRNMAKECINRNGIRYVRLVSDSRSKGLITVSDMIRYLDLKTKHFEELNATI